SLRKQPLPVPTTMEIIPDPVLTLTSDRSGSRRADSSTRRACSSERRTYWTQQARPECRPLRSSSVTLQDHFRPPLSSTLSIVGQSERACRSVGTSNVPGFFNVPGNGDMQKPEPHRSCLACDVPGNFARQWIKSSSVFVDI